MADDFDDGEEEEEEGDDKEKEEGDYESVMMTWRRKMIRTGV